MSGAVPPFPQYAYMAWRLVKEHRDNFIFTLLMTKNVRKLTVVEENQTHYQLILIWKHHTLTAINIRSARYLFIQDSFIYVGVKLGLSLSVHLLGPAESKVLSRMAGPKGQYEATRQRRRVTISFIACILQLQ
jgi:hypothetical protein